MTEIIKELRSTASNPKRLATEIIDDYAGTEPDKIYAEIPVSTTSFDDGFRQVTYRQLADVVNAAAWWLRRNIGVVSDFKTLAYIGPNDLSYIILLLAAVKAGCKMLFTAPVYTYLEQSKVFRSTDCDDLILLQGGDNNTAIITGFKNEISCLNVHYLPDLWSLPDGNPREFPFTKTWAEARSEPLMVLHTSGTTGLPKPIVWTHDWATSFSHQVNLVPPPGYDALDESMLRRRLFTLMPPFHASGFFVNLVFGIFNGTTIILPPTRALPSIALAADIVKVTKIDIVSAIPPYIEQLGASPDLIKVLAKNGAPSVVWAGAVISTAAGQAISSRLKLWNCYDSSEQGAWPNICLTGSWHPDRWGTLCIHPSSGIEFRQATDDLYAAYVVRNAAEDDADSIIQPVFRIFPDLREFNTKDLFRKHPTLPNHWLYHGRSDDMQVTRSGLNIHPVSMEQRLTRVDGVSAAVLVAHSLLDEVVVLIEPRKDASKKKIQQNLPPAISFCNQMLPSYYPLLLRNIFIIDAGIYLPRTAKGSIQRQEAMALGRLLYRQKIHA